MECRVGTVLGFEPVRVYMSTSTDIIGLRGGMVGTVTHIESF